MSELHNPSRPSLPLDTETLFTNAMSAVSAARQRLIAIAEGDPTIKAMRAEECRAAALLMLELDRLVAFLDTRSAPPLPSRYYVDLTTVLERLHNSRAKGVRP